MSGWKGVIAGAAGMLLVLALIALLIILTGSYNVAATDGNGPLATWALRTTTKNAVQGSAKTIASPVALTPSMVVAGAAEYREHCADCHGGIGEEPAAWAQAMRPTPPPLTRVANEWTPEQIYWIVAHGIRMSGMPAFGASHDEESLWNIVAFVKQLPTMSGQEYRTYMDQARSDPPPNR